MSLFLTTHYNSHNVQYFDHSQYLLTTKGSRLQLPTTCGLLHHYKTMATIRNTLTSYSTILNCSGIYTV